MPKLNDFKALLFDVDNTLTTTHKEFTATVRDVLPKLHARGFATATCTGKAYCALKSYAMPLFSSEELHITAGGSQVVTTHGTVQWEQRIAPEIATQLCRTLDAMGGRFYVAQPEGLYATDNLLEYLDHHRFQIKHWPLTALTNFSTPLIGVYHVDNKIRAVLQKFSTQISYKDMYHHLSNQAFCDITAAGVTKATGLREWSRLTGIPLSQVIGFGDSENDSEFLEAVGFAVAMGNATPEVKAQADRVIGHTNDDGLGIYLSAILEGAPL